MSNKQNNTIIPDASLLGKYTSTFGASNSFVYDNNDMGNYSAKGYTYPLDLLSAEPNPYGGNYMIFFINVAESSTLLGGNNGEKTVDIANTDRMRAAINQVGSDLSSVAQGVSTTITAAVTKAITNAATNLGKVGSLKDAMNLKDAAVTAAAAGTVAAAAGGKMSRQQKRLQKVIALPIPQNLNVKYSSHWGETETALFQGINNLSAGGMKAVTDANNNKTKNNQMTDPAAAGTIASLATYGALAKTELGAALSIASGLAPNPKKEMLFTGMDFRSFQLDWQFAPRNSEELNTVYNIINTFKLHMHPEFKDQASFIYIYPSEFDIQYYHKKTENPYLHKHTSCVLKDVSVSYTPNGTFNTFSGDILGKGAGAPTIINLSLMFTELAMLTKAEIQRGF